MDSLISNLREKRNEKQAEREKMEKDQELKHQRLLTELKELKDERLRCTESIVKNLNMITGHRHTITKVVNESKQCTGLPISNTHHRRALDVLSDAMNLVNDQENLYTDSIDICKLSTNLQSCTHSTADNLKTIESSIDKAETLIQNIHIIVDRNGDEDAVLETSIF